MQRLRQVQAWFRRDSQEVRRQHALLLLRETQVPTPQEPTLRVPLGLIESSVNREKQTRKCTSTSIANSTSCVCVIGERCKECFFLISLPESVEHVKDVSVFWPKSNGCTKCYSVLFIDSTTDGNQCGGHKAQIRHHRSFTRVLSN